MKKLSTLLLISLVFIFGLTQCKKNVETITPNNLGEAVHITVNVDDGGKHIVYPGTGAYVFENGDKLYVGNGGHYIGTLEYNSGAFSGDIYSPSTDDYLHFYFLGNLATGDITEGSTTSFTVNIADQSSNLPVLSYAHSTQKYVDGTTTYGCILLNKCGLVKFVPAAATSETVIVGGMKTTATISFVTEHEGITPTGATGDITLYSENKFTKWAILLPQDAVSSPDVDIEDYNSTITSVPAVTENMYYTTGVNIAMISTKGILNGIFTVSSGKTVNFSKGNLQYIGNVTAPNTPYWKFAENQYDYIGTGQNGDATNVDRDLFGWGTSGYNHGANCYQPWSTSTEKSDYYPYGSNSANLYNSTGMADWGYNAISNGGDVEKFGWRTLQTNEWVYLLNTRTTGNTINKTDNARYTEALINTGVTSVKGIILFPDTYTAGTPAGVTWGTINASNNRPTQCTTAGWASLEAAGCVFLPAAGYRSGTEIGMAGTNGFYWSSSNDYVDRAHCAQLSTGYIVPNDTKFKYTGLSVRLVIEN